MHGAVNVAGGSSIDFKVVFKTFDSITPAHTALVVFMTHS